jgi:hypothetical protein
MIPIVLFVSSTSPLLSINCLNGCNWSSSDSSVAQVQENNTVKGLRVGQATVTARSKDTGVIVDSAEVFVSPDIVPPKFDNLRRLSDAAIAGIVVGSVVFVAAVIAIVLAIYFGVKKGTKPIVKQ